MDRTELARVLASLTDDEFAAIVAESRTPSTADFGGMARGRAAFEQHKSLASIQVEPEPITHYVIDQG